MEDKSPCRFYSQQVFYKERVMKKNVMCEVEEALEILKSGEMLIVTDDEDRENEGDFLMAAEYASLRKSIL